MLHLQPCQYFPLVAGGGVGPHPFSFTPDLSSCSVKSSSPPKHNTITLCHTDSASHRAHGHPVLPQGPSPSYRTLLVHNWCNQNLPIRSLTSISKSKPFAKIWSSAFSSNQFLPLLMHLSEWHLHAHGASAPNPAINSSSTLSPCIQGCIQSWGSLHRTCPKATTHHPCLFAASHQPEIGMASWSLNSPSISSPPSTQVIFHGHKSDYFAPLSQSL